MMPNLYFDNYAYNIIIVVSYILLTTFLNIYLNGVYNHLSKYKNTLGKDGKSCIEYFLKNNKLSKLDIYPSQSAGYLDSYSSKKRRVFLNLITYTSADVSSLSKVIYLIAPEAMEKKDRDKFAKLDFIESLLFIIYIVIGPGLLWFGLLFKINILIYIGLFSHLVYFIYHLVTLKVIKKRIDVAYDFICKISTNENEKIYINKIYNNQKTIYLLSFLLENCKLFNILLPQNMKKIKLSRKQER